MALVLERLSTTSFADPVSPQSQALDWVANDSFTHSAQLGNDRLLQRFALATTLISLHYESQLEETDECGWANVLRSYCGTGSEDLSMDMVWHQWAGGTILPELSLLSAMTSLKLNGNSLSGSIPSQLSVLTGLTWLQINNNLLTGKIPPELSSLTALRILDFLNNRLTGEIPPQLSALTAVTHLSLGTDLRGRFRTSCRH